MIVCVGGVTATATRTMGGTETLLVLRAGKRQQERQEQVPRPLTKGAAAAAAAAQCC